MLKKVSDVECFERSEKKQMRCWFLILSPPYLTPPRQVDFWQVYQQGHVWCQQWDHYQQDRVHKSLNKVAALCSHETLGLQIP